MLMPDLTTRYTELIQELGYARSPNYVTEPDQLPEAAHLLRSAREARVRGAYVFCTGPSADPVLPPRPAVYVAEGRDEEDARRIHRLVWNQGAVPFLIVVLPSHVRVYAGFLLDREGDSDLLAEAPIDDWARVREALAGYFAAQIDDGQLWTHPRALRPEQRVDAHLLRNLQALSTYLVRERNLAPEVAHALIGKYIYIRYLKDRSILSPEWLAEYQIDIESVLGSGANLAGLRRLVEVLENRFKGQVFPLALDGPDAPCDDDVKLVAEVFGGLDLPSQQLALDFDVYDFSYIPVELLSSIYEQFLHVEGKGAEAGAYYTPEPVVDYILAEIHSQRPLRPEDRVLDPCCGSGVFLVLAFRRLIEAARAALPDRKLRPDELRTILERGIFGVERNREACYVTEFSLILTLLGYVEPPDLHHNEGFEFPALHNKNIFECDFFDPECAFAQAGLRFDWIIGNPPWLELKGRPEDRHVLGWIDANKDRYPVARARSADAFLWRVREFIEPDGMIALLIQATSLTNAQLEDFRRSFFRHNQVRRITNFSNLAYSLFAGSAETPAASVVYRPGRTDGDQPPIVHYGPFAANQILTRSAKRSRPWAITIFEDEITTVSPAEAATGDARIWKLAMWGTYRDARTLARLTSRLPTTLGELATNNGWSLTLGLQLRDGSLPAEQQQEQVQHVPELRGEMVLEHSLARRIGWRLTVPPQALAPIPEHECYVRTGRTRGVQFLRAPHLWIDPEFAAFSDHDFVLRHPLTGLAAPPESADYLRALSVFLNSSVARYLGFFESAAWGMDRTRMNLNEVRSIRIPHFDAAQVADLSALHRELAADEAREDVLLLPLEDSQERIDRAVFTILDVPAEDVTVIHDFVYVRLLLNKGKTRGEATEPPDPATLEAYGRCLRDQLDDYAELRHRVTLWPSRELIACEVQIVDSSDPVEPLVAGPDRADQLQPVWDAIRSQQSQWIYVQRGLRIFDGERVVLCKPPRRVNWTCMKALLDSDDIISEVVEQVGFGG
jgi:hypothetical protein